MLELTAHLKQKAAELQCKGLGQIKIALAGTDMTSLLELLQTDFGCLASSESDDEENVLEKEEKTSEVKEKAIAKPPEAGNLSIAELIFPFRSSPSVVAGIPEIYLPLCGPETLSHNTVKSPHVLLILPKKQWPAIMSIVVI